MDENCAKDDRYLVEACLKKDLAAWSSLVKKYSALVCIAIKNRLERYDLRLSRQDIEDIKQGVFADIWQGNKLKAIENRADISYWIAIISGNAAMEHFRKKDARLWARTVSLSGKIGEGALEDILPSEVTDPEKKIARAETEDRIDLAIESLPEKEKLMIKLHLIHDKKYHEIAVLLDVPKGTVSSYIKRGKEKLRKLLKKY